jgi:hypothetical protein
MNAAPDFHNAATLEGAGDLTVFTDGLAQTDKTDKTYLIGNGEFC